MFSISLHLGLKNRPMCVSSDMPKNIRVGRSDKSFFFLVFFFHQILFLLHPNNSNNSTNR